MGDDELLMLNTLSAQCTQGNFWGDRYVHYFDCGIVVIVSWVHIFVKHTKSYTVNLCALLYIHTL